MKKPFAVGDKVIFYHAQEFTVGGVVYSGPLVCTIIEIGALLKLKDVYAKEHYAHPKQCRRLVNKKKGVRVTREMLAKAWIGARCGRPDISDYFNNFCKELGLDGDK